MVKYKRGEIYWVKLDPTMGNEIKKTRPGLIVSSNNINKCSKLLMIAPITHTIKKVYPFEVETILKGDSAKILLNQCRAVDKLRLVDKVAILESATMLLVEEALKIVFSMK